MKSSNTQAIIKHLFEISIGKCQITEEMILNEKDVSMQTILTGLLMLSEDIEYKRKQNERSLQEKETLLKEVHHRVKNNLQVITSLLGLQASFIDDENVKGLFRYSQYRITSMSKVHELLYQSEDFSRINYKKYLIELVSGLIVSMKGNQNNIRLITDIVDVNLNLDTAMPLGILINEIVTNSLKYGIKEENEGEIYIKLETLDYPQFKLSIKDNGVGFSDEVNFRTSNSLGLKLIHKLSSQLRGSIEKDNDHNGTSYIINFQEIEHI